MNDYISKQLDKSYVERLNGTNKEIDLDDFIKSREEINKILLDTEKKIFSEEEKMYSLKEFKEYQNKKREEIMSIDKENHNGN